ncbi:MAG: hypothetical protein UNLARM2_1022 [Candidatus Micrarchaeum acidiphilum ARMAN-2]|uniref:Uncharacterized protein n=1 Tax=Candidatus Micrarchaeum acidiphilum ARMAN-2 TaxID=425595 RepID=C7DHD3_MICA2|nr:MAG: hypothetical protein UNLARM2_1022 [Candidatus Micrarchaeum acidiphilum ARMAN-2]
MISNSLILWISVPFLGFQVTLYELLFDRFFKKRFDIFNEAIKKYIKGDVNKFIAELKKQNKKKSNTNSIIDAINIRADALSELNNLRAKRYNLTNLAKFSYLLIGASAFFGLLASGVIIQRPFLFSLPVSNVGSVDALDILFMASVLLLFYLGYSFLDLNHLLEKYEKEGTLSEIIAEINEANEE